MSEESKHPMTDAAWDSVGTMSQYARSADLWQARAMQLRELCWRLEEAWAAKFQRERGGDTRND